MAKTKKKGNVVTVDFTGVEAGGVTVPEDKYEVEVEVVNSETSDNDNDYLAWEFKISEGKQKGKKLWHNTSLQQQSLWALRGLLEALGIEIPDEPLDLDLEDLVGRTVGVEVQHETYNKKTKARIVDFFEIGAEEENDVEEEPKKSSKKASNDDEEEDDEEEVKSSKKKGKKEKRTYTSDSVLEKDEDELQALVDEHELEVDLSEFEKLRKKRSAVIEALEQEGLLEDEAA